MYDLIITVGLSLILGAIGLFFGRVVRRKHTERLDRRQQLVAHIRQSDTRAMPDALTDGAPPQLFVSEVTLGADYFITFVAKLRNLVGGRMRVFEEVLLRARREALMRICEQAQAAGYNALANVRLDFVDISGVTASRRKRPAVMVSILASATAYRAADDSQPVRS